MMKSLLLLLLAIPAASAFVPTAPHAATRQSSSVLQLSEISDVLTSSSQAISLLKEVSKDQAEFQFYFLFFAGSGAGGLGIAQIPKIFKELNFMKELSQQGPTEGGEPLNGASPLVPLLYPKQLTEKDVRKAIAKLPTSAQIVAKGTSTSFFASKGYVVQQDFIDSLKGCNPLTAYALYQAVSSGSGKVVSPDDVDEKREAYKQDATLATFTADLNGSVVTRLSSYAALAFLLFVTADLIIETGINAFL